MIEIYDVKEWGKPTLSNYINNLLEFIYLGSEEL